MPYWLNKGGYACEDPARNHNWVGSTCPEGVENGNTCRISCLPFASGPPPAEIRCSCGELEGTVPVCEPEALRVLGYLTFPFSIILAGVLVWRYRCTTARWQRGWAAVDISLGGADVASDLLLLSLLHPRHWAFKVVLCSICLPMLVSCALALRYRLPARVLVLLICGCADIHVVALMVEASQQADCGTAEGREIAEKLTTQAEALSLIATWNRVVMVCVEDVPQLCIEMALIIGGALDREVITAVLCCMFTLLGLCRQSMFFTLGACGTRLVSSSVTV